MNKEYIVLSIADRKLSDTNWEWLVDLLEKHRPEGIEMSEDQFYKLTVKLDLNGAMPHIRGIPVRFTKRSFLGIEV